MENNTVQELKKRTSKGKQKIEIKKIEKIPSRYVTFSKRSRGLFKKCKQLCSSYEGSQFAVVAFSIAGKPISEGYPSADAVIQRFLNDSRGDLVGFEASSSSCATNWWEKSIDNMSLIELEEFKMSLEGLRNKVSSRFDQVTHLSEFSKGMTERFDVAGRTNENHGVKVSERCQEKTERFNQLTHLQEVDRFDLLGYSKGMANDHKNLLGVDISGSCHEKATTDIFDLLTPIEEVDRFDLLEYSKGMTNDHKNLFGVDISGSCQEKATTDIFDQLTPLEEVDRFDLSVFSKGMTNDHKNFLGVEISASCQEKAMTDKLTPLEEVDRFNLPESLKRMADHKNVDVEISGRCQKKAKTERFDQHTRLEEGARFDLTEFSKRMIDHKNLVGRCQEKTERSDYKDWMEDTVPEIYPELLQFGGSFSMDFIGCC